MSVPQPYRPGILNLVTIVSFVLSGLNVLWLIVISVLVLIAGALTWLGGPIVGALGTAVGIVVVIILLAQFCLSVLLFMAAWGTMYGTPEGRERHKLWAWIIVVVDLIDLLLFVGMDAGAWFRLGYAIFLIVVMDRPEVRAYLSRPALVP